MAEVYPLLASSSSSRNRSSFSLLLLSIGAVVSFGLWLFTQSRGASFENGVVDDALSDQHLHLLHSLRRGGETVRQLQYDRWLIEGSEGNGTSNNNGSCDVACCSSMKDEVCGPSSVEGTNLFAGLPPAVQILLIVLLLSFSALFAGLTLGLLSLDKTGLEIVMGGDDEVKANYARRIYPIRKSGNLLLCTLVLGNIGLNSLLSILMADKAGGLAGFLISTFSIVIFAEIIPQALCSMHALRIGSATAPLVRVLMIILYPVTFPLSFIMDKVLGEELVITYSSSEMVKLLQIQVQEKRMDQDVAQAMKGALMYKSTLVSKVMTPIQNVFMLEADARLNFECLASIFKAGYSRIPVYEIDKNNVIGLLFVKDLIFIDPEDSTRVGDFVEIFGRVLNVVWQDDTLGDVIGSLKSGTSHMALVRDVNNSSAGDPYYELKGIITLEDIIEEIIGDEIVDETDAYVDGSQSEKVDRPQNFRWASLRLLDAKIVDETLSFDEARAMAAHLSKNYSSMVELLTDHQLNKLLSELPVSVLPTAEQKAGQLLPDDLLYEKGIPSDVCTLIMSGKVTVIAGADSFRSDVSSWSLLGAGALVDSSYAPDFSAYVASGPCRCLRITRARFSAAVDASAIERHSHQNGSNNDSLSNFQGMRRTVPPPSAAAVGTRKELTTHLIGEERSFYRSKLLAALQVFEDSEVVAKPKQGPSAAGEGLSSLPEEGTTEAEMETDDSNLSSRESCADSQHHVSVKSLYSSAYNNKDG